MLTEKAPDLGSHLARCLIAALASATLSGCFEEPQQLELPETPILEVPPPPPTEPTPAPPVEEIGVAARTWELTSLDVKGKRVAIEGEGTINGEVNETRRVGALTYAPSNRDAFADVEVYSSQSGATYWVEAEAPIADFSDAAAKAGSKSNLEQWHFFRKNALDSSLTLVISELAIELDDFNDFRTRPPVCSWIAPAATDHPRCFDQLSGVISFGVVVTSEADNNKVFVHGLYSGSAQIVGYNGEWNWQIGYVDAISSDLFLKQFSNRPVRAIFRPEHFETSIGSIELLPIGQQVFIRLRSPVRVSLDLSRIPQDKEFRVVVKAIATALNRRGRESYAQARFRDPISAGGVVVEQTGLTELRGTAADEPLPAPEPEPYVCELPNDQVLPTSAGAAQFALDAYLVPEFELPTATVMVHRQGGAQGPLAVHVRSASGTALVGTDYEPVDELIVFPDGDDVPRAVRIHTTDDALDRGDRSLTLSLTAERNCGRIGGRNSTTVTIVGDDGDLGGSGTPPPIANESIGGTVTGLIGSGLVLEERIEFVSLPVTSDGPFAFTRSYPIGASYDVRVRTNPSNPAQACTVSNGTGTNAGGVTNILISCAPPAATTGLDPGFGNDGRVSSSLAGGAIAMALQPDGKLLVLNEQRRIQRFNTDGSLDTGFGSGGNVTISFGGTGDRVRSLAVQSDGRILAAGSVYLDNQDEDFAVARLDSTGGLDPSFGVGGNAYLAAPGRVDQGEIVLVQADGRIVVAGVVDVAPPPLRSYADFAVARFNSDGSVDRGFGTGGRTMVDLAGRTDLVRAAALQSDGRIVVVGRVADGPSTTPDVGLARFNGDGSVDTSFGSSGVVVRDLNGQGAWDEASSVAIQSDGKIVISALNRSPGAPNRFTVARFNADGSLDNGFATNGVSTTAFSSGDDYSRGLAIEPGGRIVAAGSTAGATPQSDFGLLRLMPDGTLDTGFDGDGQLTIDFFGATDGANAVLIQPDGRIVAAGVARNGSFFGLGLVRIVP